MSSAIIHVAKLYRCSQSYRIKAAPKATAANPPLTTFLTSALLLGAPSALAVVLVPALVAEALEAVVLAEVAFDELSEALALLLAAADADEDAAAELLAALEAEADADAVALALEAETDSTVLLESITNWGV